MPILAILLVLGAVGGSAAYYYYSKKKKVTDDVKGDLAKSVVVYTPDVKATQVNGSQNNQTFEFKMTSLDAVHVYPATARQGRDVAVGVATFVYAHKQGVDKDAADTILEQLTEVWQGKILFRTIQNSLLDFITTDVVFLTVDDVVDIANPISWGGYFSDTDKASLVSKKELILPNLGALNYYATKAGLNEAPPMK